MGGNQQIVQIFKLAVEYSMFLDFVYS